MSEKHLSVYYFKGQDFCVDPRVIRADMERLAEAAVDSVCIAFHEGDLAGSNLPLVCDEAKRAGLSVWAVPSRIGGLIAGWHRAVGNLSASRPDLWARHPDGNPVNFFGPQISVHHPEAVVEFTRIVDQMLNTLPIEGIIWDELKCTDTKDHSEAAIKALGHPSDGGPEQFAATASFFSKVNRGLLDKHPKLQIAMFLYCWLEDELIEHCVKIDGLNEFGCDGACLLPEDEFEIEGGHTKKLLPENFKRFAKGAEKGGLRKFVLVETQRQKRGPVERSLEHLDQLFAQKPDHVVYYDFPREMEASDQLQPKLAEKYKQWRKS